MLINGVDISNYNASILDRTITPNTVITVNDWLDGASSPTFIRQQDSFKEIEVELLVNSGDEEQNVLDISNIVSLAKHCIINFDDDISSLNFPCTLEGTPEVKRLKPGVQSLTLTFKSGYGEAKPIVTSKEYGANEMTIRCKGTVDAPAIVTITVNDVAAINRIDFTFDNGKFSMINLQAGQKYIINTEESLIIDGEGNSQIDKFEGFYLPKLVPGLNNIKVSWTIGYNLTVEYKPRYI